MRLVSTIMDLPEVERKIIKTLSKEYRRTMGDVFNLYIHMDRSASDTMSILNLTSTKNK